MASTEPALAPKPEEKDACSTACATLGLDHVVGFTQKIWKDVSHTPFLGNMSDDTGAVRLEKPGEVLVKNKAHFDAMHADHLRRPSYHEPTSPTAGEVEVGVAYSQEEEMTGRLHDQMVENSKKSQSNLASAA